MWYLIGSIVALSVTLLFGTTIAIIELIRKAITFVKDEEEKEFTQITKYFLENILFGEGEIYGKWGSLFFGWFLLFVMAALGAVIWPAGILSILIVITLLLSRSIYRKRKKK